AYTSYIFLFDEICNIIHLFYFYNNIYVFFIASVKDNNLFNSLPNFDNYLIYGIYNFFLHNGT
ncbi:unnamed protein product, partial [marine sediment metagenome]